MKRIIAIAVLLGALVSPAFAEDKKSLYDRLGGVGPISVVVDEFINRLVKDATLNKNPAIKEARDRVPAPYLKYHVTAMVCMATGGPCKYTGRDMKAAHAQMGLTRGDFNALVEILQVAMDARGIPFSAQNKLLSRLAPMHRDIEHQ